MFVHNLRHSFYLNILTKKLLGLMLFSVVVSKLRACIPGSQCDEIEQGSKGEMYNQLYSIVSSNYFQFDNPNADSEGSVTFN